MQLLFASLVAVHAALLAGTGSDTAAENPIRRIVTMLQKMQTEVSAEQKRDDELTERFVCYCTTNDGDLSDSTKELRERIPELESDITEAVSLKQQLDAELKAHQADRADAKAAILAAEKQREKEAADFAAASTELKTNICACESATNALSGGLRGEKAFLQSTAANQLRSLLVTTAGAKLDRYSREALTEFLQERGSAHYTPVSQEVIGILHTLGEDMKGDLKSITAVEDDALVQFQGLIAAKEKEIAAATEQIESKTARAGDTAVQIVSLKNDLTDTQESLGADTRFLMELKKNCASKQGEYDERKGLRSEEMVAITETIKILNDDDALDTFKKTLPSPALLQLVRSNKDVQKKALKELRKVKTSSAELNMIMLALHGKKEAFTKVIKMIDDMNVALAQEQKDDDEHKEFCSTEFGDSADTESNLNRRIGDLETKIDETAQAISGLIEETEGLKKGIKELDRQVEDATGQRKDEHKNFVNTQAESNAALDLLELAKNRLNKMYNPSQYVAPKPEDVTDEVSFVQVRMRDEPPPAPETGDDYEKKDAGGPVALIDKLRSELQRDMQEQEHDEKEGQKDYEEFMSDSVTKRTADSKAITEKEAQKAELEADHSGAKDIRKTKLAELMATQEYIQQLHGSCDFLVKNYDTRMEARANEVESLKKAKAVLSGADFSFRQAATKAFLKK